MTTLTPSALVARLHAYVRPALLSRASSNLRRGIACGTLRVAWRDSDDGCGCTLYRLHAGRWRAVACYLGGPGEADDEVARATAEAELARWL